MLPRPVHTLNTPKNQLETPVMGSHRRKSWDNPRTGTGPAKPHSKTFSLAIPSGKWPQELLPKQYDVQPCSDGNVESGALCSLVPRGLGPAALPQRGLLRPSQGKLLLPSSPLLCTGSRFILPCLCSALVSQVWHDHARTMLSACSHP